MYSGDATAPVRRSRASRHSRRNLVRARRAALSGGNDGPSLRVERLPPITELLRAYREGRTDDALPEHVRALRSEVEALERWADARPRHEQLSGTTTRLALDFLRGFGRITALDFSSIPSEERDLLVELLALEHRWCYAAAGTTRDAFKIAVGRTGAR